jgi:(p)ppGpp synthase/HD superfamily hydrolase
MSIEQIQFIKQLFDGKFDKSGEEYWYHCLTVANMARVRADIYKWSKSDCNICYLIGLYHDVIEDTDYSLDKTMETIQQLNDCNSKEIKEIRIGLDNITKRKHESHLRYINRVCQSIYSLLVKIEDSRHNSIVERFPKENRTEEIITKCNFYDQQVTQLTKIFNEQFNRKRI